MLSVKRWVAALCILGAAAVGYGVGLGDQQDAERTQQRLTEELHRAQDALNSNNGRKALPPDIFCAMYSDC